MDIDQLVRDTLELAHEAARSRSTLLVKCVNCGSSINDSPAWKQHRKSLVTSSQEALKTTNPDLLCLPCLSQHVMQWLETKIVERKRSRRFDASYPNYDIRVIQQNKRAECRGLIGDLTVNQWQNALRYFHNTCPVCGQQFDDLWGDRLAAIDHWIPISSPECPGTTVLNIIPLCHGVGGCNNRKSNRDPVEFLETEFGKRRAREILKRINAYFASLTAQENAA